MSAFAPLADHNHPDVSPRLRALCKYAKCVLTSLGPRTHRANDDDSPVLIFTDGAFEGGRATAGAVVLDTATGEGTCFEVEVPQVLLNKWLETADQVISQVELWVGVCGSSLEPQVSVALSSSHCLDR